MHAISAVKLFELQQSYMVVVYLGYKRIALQSQCPSALGLTFEILKSCDS